MNAVRPARFRSALLAGSAASVMIATVLVATPAPAVVGCPVLPETLPTSEMHPGMTGTGQTVLQGTAVEPFDVEILGVLPDAIFLGVDIVVAEITGPAAFLDTTGGAVAGMSGSPVYVNGKLAGAVAWAIAEDRHIFGMTAAEDMVGIFDLQDTISGTVPSRIPLSRAVIETARAEGTMLTDTAALRSLPIPLGVSGLNGLPLSQVEDTFAEHGVRVSAYRAGSVTAPGPDAIDPTPFAPGEGLGVALSYGDISWYGFGTTTAVCGDLALGFGHPMFWGQGEVSLGMTDVDVFAIDNGTFWGTKIGVIGDTHGVLTQDRFAGVAGVFGLAPNLVAVTSDVSSPDTGLSRQGRTDIAWDEDWFVADAAYYHGWSNFTYVQQTDGPGTVSFDFAIDGTRADGTPFTVTNRWFEASDWGAAYGIWRLVDFLYILTYNEFEPVTFTGVDFTGTITGDVKFAQIGQVRLSSALSPNLKARRLIKAEPGDRVTVEVTFERADGEPDVVTTFSMRVRRSDRGDELVRLSGGRGRIDVWGRSVGSFDELLDALNGGDHLNDLIVRGLGKTRLKAQDVVVLGKHRFVVRVVR